MRTLLCVVDVLVGAVPAGAVPQFGAADDATKYARTAGPGSTVG